MLMATILEFKQRAVKSPIGQTLTITHLEMEWEELVGIYGDFLGVDLGVQLLQHAANSEEAALTESFRMVPKIITGKGRIGPFVSPIAVEKGIKAFNEFYEGCAFPTFEIMIAAFLEMIMDPTV